LNLKSKGEWITCYIELPENYRVADIDVSTILLNGTIGAELKPTAYGDYDNDLVPDLMVKFSRAEAVSYILAEGKGKSVVALTVAGKLKDGTPFEGSDTVRIVMEAP